MGEANGVGTQAARLAGYSGDENTLHVQAWRLLRKATVKAAIRERVHEDPSIVTREERIQFLSSLVRGDDHRQPGTFGPVIGPPGLPVRVKAAELLARMGGELIERISVEDPDAILAKVLGIQREEIPAALNAKESDSIPN